MNRPQMVDIFKWQTKMKEFPMAFTQFCEADPAQASALGSAFKWLNLSIIKGPWALSCLLGFADSSFSSPQRPDAPPTQTDVHKAFKVVR